ncbi:MAG: hypothetical protein SV375_11330, partial [Thermodesulfobacteriota bacterium]|nr:hypothetical protein [Thermodesulfobacteriota bacterium]
RPPRKRGGGGGDSRVSDDSRAPTPLRAGASPHAGPISPGTGEWVILLPFKPRSVLCPRGFAAYRQRKSSKPA